MGGKINNGSEIFLYGRIRSGRSNETKNELLTKLRDIIKKKLNLNTDNIWVYLIDLPPNQMIEYGQILPNSGEEKEWFKNLPDELRKRLQSMEWFMYYFAYGTNLNCRIFFKKFKKAIKIKMLSAYNNITKHMHK